MTKFEEYFSAIFVAALLTAAPATALAQEEHVLLARTCVSESGWASPDDCRAIHEVILYIAERSNVSYRRAWELASPRLAECTVSRRWLCQLDDHGRMPRGMAHYRERWETVLSLTRRLTDGDERAVCRPRAWGSHEDVRRRSALGRARWVEMDCGDTRNRFGGWVRIR